VKNTVAGNVGGTAIVAEVLVGGQAAGHDRWQTLSTWAAGALVIVAGAVSVAGAVVIPARQHELAASAGQRSSGIPLVIPPGTVSLMRLSPAPAGPAPGFTLTDQDGRVLSLSGFRGKAVVLEFTDSRCTSICPLISQESVDAFHDLGRAQGRVVFVAVNVNPRYNQVADVLAYSRAHALSALPDWYFLTGPASELAAVCREYHIAVTAGSLDLLVHTATVFFIGPHGNERYVAAPAADYTGGGATYLPPGQVSAWGRGIAQVAEATLT
jgi:cytochrome oxidase Cu insertion factor (SCO1/SenC/PrrC family)